MQGTQIKVIGQPILHLKLSWKPQRTVNIETTILSWMPQTKFYMQRIESALKADWAAGVEAWLIGGISDMAN